MIFTFYNGRIDEYETNMEVEVYKYCVYQLPWI